MAELETQFINSELERARNYLLAAMQNIEVNLDGKRYVQFLNFEFTRAVFAEHIYIKAMQKFKPADYLPTQFYLNEGAELVNIKFIRPVIIINLHGKITVNGEYIKPDHYYRIEPGTSAHIIAKEDTHTVLKFITQADKSHLKDSFKPEK